MSKRLGVRICRYSGCPYNHKVDISTDNYKLNGAKSYYHLECWQKKCEEDSAKERYNDEQRKARDEKKNLKDLQEKKRRSQKKETIEKSEKTKADLLYIRNNWGIHISKTVPYGQLMKCLNDLIARGISSDYLVFTFDYVVKHKLNLNYPAGFQYFLDRKEIKEAYNKSKLPKYQNSMFSINDKEFKEPQDIIPRIITENQKGFGKIFKKKG